MKDLSADITDKYALVKRVLELMDGDIQVASEEGKGSTFIVTLPVAGI